MKNVAILTDGVVENIIICSDDYQLKDNEIEYFDSNPACIGGEFSDGFFYEPQPFPSWTKNNGRWVPPVAPPESNRETNPNNLMLLWDEEAQEWYFA